MIIDGEASAPTHVFRDSSGFIETKDNKLANSAFDQELQGAIKGVTEKLTENRIGLAAEIAYLEFWHTFCDKNLEEHKGGLLNDRRIVDGFKKYLLLLHPFAPFVTEAVWSEVFPDEGLLINQKWPNIDS